MEVYTENVEYFNFGGNMINWISTCICYNEISSCVINNGWTTEFFSINCGVRQGCPLSPYIFILTTEVLATQVRSNPDITGIIIDNEEFLISQYADDTSLSLIGGAVTIRRVLELFSRFEIVSGLKVNREKTQIMPLGNHYLDKAEIEHMGLHWTKGPITTLGIKLEHTLQKTFDLNLVPKLEKLIDQIKIWSKRKMTPFGKITIKSEIISHLQYVLSITPTPPGDYL
jgi:hypothetical protein